ncbi:MAG: LCP family protein, partial [Chloroflexi bacterium]|nr:LCP family protein [Chloroflexota bacterium]
SLFPGKSDRIRGYGALKTIVGDSLGIPINDFVQVDMEGFRDVVDTLGGAIVDVQLPVYDSRYSSDDGRGAIKLYVPPGIHFMTGAQALAYSRSRHSSSDFDRSSRQMRMITALRAQIDIPNLIGDIGALQNIIKKDIRTDIPSAKLAQLAELAQSIDLDKRISLQLTPQGGFSTGCQQLPASTPLCQENGIYALVAKVSAMQRAVKNVFTTDPRAIEQQQTLDSEAAVVQVLNGTASSNEKTTNLSDYLGYVGLNSSVPPVNAGKADRGDYPSTVITAYNGAQNDMPETIKVLEQELGVKAVTADDPAQTANIVVIVGKDTPRKKPPAGS